MITVAETKKQIEADSRNWLIPFMDFVDDLRRYKNRSAVENRFEPGNEKIDALLASAIEYLCAEIGMDNPEWTWDIPSCKEPWFVSGVENLKAIALAESPVYFRRRKIFVLENFLQRV